MRQAILDRLSPGDVVEGTISNIVDFGAFVDLEGIDGLIHISELSWSHVNHPSELLEIGQEVRVKVLDIDRDRQRISLGLKQTQSDPWQQVIDTYEQGDVVEGRVTKVVTFGAFVEVVPGVEGLVHISELATHHVENPREIVQQAENVRAKIIEMDAERRRLSLSLKRVEEGESTRPGIGEAGAPELGLSEEVFTEGAALEDAPEAEEAPEQAAPEEVPEQAAAEPEPEAAAEEPEAAEPQLEAGEESAPQGGDEPSEEWGEQPVVQAGPTETVGAAAQEEAAPQDEAAPEGEASAEPDDDAER
jgi:small subunit ribosomal protein S1